MSITCIIVPKNVHLTFLLSALPPKVIVSWCDDETHTSSKSAHVQIIPDQGIPFVIYPGVWTLECNFGPDNNAWGKKKWKEEQMKKLNVDHPQGKSVKRVKTYDGRRLGCPAKIQIKEAFIVNGYAVSRCSSIIVLTRIFCVQSFKQISEFIDNIYISGRI